MSAKPASPAQETGIIHLERIAIQRLEVPIIGVTPLIVHRWSEKAKRQLIEPKSPTRAKKEPLDPERDYQDSRYRLADGRDGMPAVAFKAAMVGAARLFEGATMVSLKQWIFIDGEGPDHLVPIEGRISRREDIVRVGIAQTMPRWRAQYDDWSALLLIDFVASAISPESIVALVDAGGIGGVGEWRPSSPKGATGMYGRFRVADTQQLTVTATR